jgi:hypothetical protein
MDWYPFGELRKMRSMLHFLTSKVRFDVFKIAPIIDRLKCHGVNLAKGGWSVDAFRTFV